MTAWETEPSLAEQSPLMADFAQIWQAADKVVYSTTLAAPVTARTSIEPAFDPAAVGRLKEAAAADLMIGGAELAGQAIDADLVDEYHLFLAPVVVGGGKAFLPSSRQVDLDLVDEHRFLSGFVHLHYRPRT
jgi:dihydrofolate reductase